MESQTLLRVKEQIEYYLSDTNLKRDEFFRNEILSNPDGYINLDHILKCNKIKSMNLSKEMVIEGLKGSDKLELHPENSGVRRKNNAPLPEPQPSKKLKTEKNSEQENLGGKAGEAHHEKPEEKENILENYEALVLELNVESKEKADWRDVRRFLEHKYNIMIIFITKELKDGFLVLNKNKIDEANLKAILSEDGIQGEKNEHIKLKTTSEESIKSFWSNHGSTYSLKIDSLKSCDKHLNKGNNRNNNNKKKKDPRGMKNHIIFGKEKYYDISKIKDIFKNLLNQTSNGEHIKEPGHTMLMELFSYHDKFSQKGQNIDYFTTDIHPEYTDTRCFFVVRKDGSKEDFSAMKCIRKLEK